jgi:predicted protein tyrosine phosphatase
MNKKVNFNRLANAKNPYQGKLKKVLCLCSASLLRSPTIAFVLSNPPYSCNTRAAGTVEDFALVFADLALIEWADEIVCAEKEHCNYAKEMLKDELITNPNKPVHCLDIPDNYGTRNPELIQIIQNKLKEIGYGKED